MILFHFGGVKMVASKETVEMLLTPKECEILLYRNGYHPNSDKPKTLEEVGKNFGVTRERIRQIEAKALEKVYQFVSRD